MVQQYSQARVSLKLVQTYQDDEVAKESQPSNNNNNNNLQFSIHPESWHRGNWSWNFIPMYTIEESIVGPVVELHLNSLILDNYHNQNQINHHEESKNVILGMISDLEVEDHVKDDIVNAIIYLAVKQINPYLEGFEKGCGGHSELSLSAGTMLVVKIGVVSEFIVDEDDFISSDEESEVGCGMVPAAKEYIVRGLEKVRLKDEEEDDKEEERKRCSICLDTIPGGLYVSRLSCLHIFHDDCIKEWLSRSHYCPLCRFQLPTE